MPKDTEATKPTLSDLISQSHHSAPECYSLVSLLNALALQIPAYLCPGD